MASWVPLKLANRFDDLSSPARVKKARVPHFLDDWVGTWLDEWVAKNNELPNTGYKLNLEDLKCLDGDEWLKDSIMHSVMQLMAYRAKERGCRHYYFEI